MREYYLACRVHSDLTGAGFDRSNRLGRTDCAPARDDLLGEGCGDLPVVHSARRLHHEGAPHSQCRFTLGHLARLGVTDWHAVLPAALEQQPELRQLLLAGGYNELAGNVEADAAIGAERLHLLGSAHASWAFSEPGG